MDLFKIPDNTQRTVVAPWDTFWERDPPECNYTEYAERYIHIFPSFNGPARVASMYSTRLQICRDTPGGMTTIQILVIGDVYWLPSTKYPPTKRQDKIHEDLYESFIEEYKGKNVRRIRELDLMEPWLDWASDIITQDSFFRFWGC